MATTLEYAALCTSPSTSGSCTEASAGCTPTEANTLLCRCASASNSGKATRSLPTHNAWLTECERILSRSCGTRSAKHFRFRWQCESTNIRALRTDFSCLRARAFFSQIAPDNQHILCNTVQFGNARQSSPVHKTQCIKESQT